MLFSCSRDVLLGRLRTGGSVRGNTISFSTRSPVYDERDRTLTLCFSLASHAVTESVIAVHSDSVRETLV
jgi:hypothetical protein